MCGTSASLLHAGAGLGVADAALWGRRLAGAPDAIEVFPSSGSLQPPVQLRAIQGRIEVPLGTYFLLVGKSNQLEENEGKLL